MADPNRRVPEGLAVEAAKIEDAPIIKSMVHAAYAKYVDRIGREPAPMTADYTELLQTHDVRVLRTSDNGKIVAAVVLSTDADSVKINNLVVDQAAQGKGYGKVMMNYAEDVARARGRPALTLFTNVKMWENMVFYPKLGFVETERRNEDGYDRVYYRKDL